MNTLDLQALGLDEMTETQMQEVDGGSWAGAVIGAVAGAEAGPIGIVVGALIGAIFT